MSFDQAIKFNRVLLQEYIALGQRVAKFKVQYWDLADNKWTELVDATTIGYKRILCTPIVTTNKVRIVIEKSLAEPILNNMEFYLSPEIPSFDVNHFAQHSLPKGDPILLELGKMKEISGFVFTPIPSEREITIMRYNCYVSQNGKIWTKVRSNAVFNNIKNNAIAQKVMFDKSVKASHLKIEPIDYTGHKSKKYTYSELEVIEK